MVVGRESRSLSPPVPRAAGRYHLLSCLGSGAMGTVFLAEHESLPGPRFAVKTLHPALAADARFVERFRREAMLAARLSHPNVVPVTDFGQCDDGRQYLVMRHVAGRSLRELLASEAPLGRERAAALIRQLALGLSHMHERGLVHRDLKPGNVLVGLEDGREVPRLLDFGMAGTLEDEALARLTADGVTLGTPLYMAPEQIYQSQVNASADLYALGVVLYEMLAGRPPFAGDGAAILAAKTAADLPRLRERTGLEDLAWRLLAPHPDDRLSSAREVIAAVDEALARPAPRGAAAPAQRPPRQAKSARPAAPWILSTRARRAIFLAAATFAGGAAAWLAGSR